MSNLFNLHTHLGQFSQLTRIITQTRFWRDRSLYAIERSPQLLPILRLQRARRLTTTRLDRCRSVLVSTALALCSRSVDDSVSRCAGGGFSLFELHNCDSDHHWHCITHLAQFQGRVRVKRVQLHRPLKVVLSSRPFAQPYSEASALVRQKATACHQCGSQL